VRDAGELSTKEIFLGALMPRFYFHVYCEGTEPSVDGEGIEMADEGAAWNEAISTCGQMIHDLDGAMRAGTVWQMEVTDDAGNRIFLLFFRAEVSATAQRAPR
jgi:hypothetical protein